MICLFILSIGANVLAQWSLSPGLVPTKPQPDAPLGLLDENCKFFFANMAYSLTAQDVKQWFGGGFGYFMKTTIFIIKNRTKSREKIKDIQRSTRVSYNPKDDDVSPYHEIFNTGNFSCTLYLWESFVSKVWSCHRSSTFNWKDLECRNIPCPSGCYKGE